MTAGPLAWALALLLQAGQPAPEPPENVPDVLPGNELLPTLEQIRAANRSKALRDGGFLLDQLLGEADEVGYSVNGGGSGRLWLQTRARGTRTDGVCESELIAIAMDRVADPLGTAPGRPARIRGVEAGKRYHQLRDPWNKPMWTVSGNALEAECAKISERGYGWYAAESADEFRVAVRSLEKVREALADPESRLIKVRCLGMRGACRLDRQRWITGIDPIDPGDVREKMPGATCGDGGRRCQRFLLLDITICGHWDLEIESDYDEPLRLRSATFTAKAGGLIHCGGEES